MRTGPCKFRGGWGHHCGLYTHLLEYIQYVQYGNHTRVRTMVGAFSFKVATICANIMSQWYM